MKSLLPFSKLYWEIDRGQSWRRGISATVNVEVVSSIPILGYEIFNIFSFFCSGDEAKRAVEFCTQHAMPLDFGRKWVLYIWFLGSPCPCGGYRVKLKNTLIFATQHAMPAKFAEKRRTESLKTRFPLPDVLCARYSLKLKITFSTFRLVFPSSET